MSGMSGPRILVINDMVNQNAIISASIPKFFSYYFVFGEKTSDAAPILPALLPKDAAMI